MAYKKENLKSGKIVEAKDVGVDDGIGEGPTFTEWVRQRIPADEGPGMIANLVESFAALRKENQTFHEWVDATGHESIAELAAPKNPSYEDPYFYDATQAWYPFANGESPAPTHPGGTPITSDD